MKVKGVEKKMSLEQYVDFFTSKKSVDFTVPYLNQILHMHGFRKLYKTSKKILGEAVNALDLLDLSRSTLKQSAVSSSTSASLTLDQVITDIEALKWQECCITSVQIINSEEITQAVPKPKPKSNKRKKSSTTKKSLDANFGDENDCTMNPGPAIPKKIRNKKTKEYPKTITPLNEEAAPKPLSGNYIIP